MMSVIIMYGETGIIQGNGLETKKRQMVFLFFPSFYRNSKDILPHPPPQGSRGKSEGGGGALLGDRV